MALGIVALEGVIPFENEDGFRARFADYHLLPGYELVFEIAELNTKWSVCNEETFRKIVTRAGKRRVKKVFAQPKHS